MNQHQIDRDTVAHLALEALLQALDPPAELGDSAELLPEIPRFDIMIEHYAFESKPGGGGGRHTKLMNTVRCDDGTWGTDDLAILTMDFGDRSQDLGGIRTTLADPGQADAAWRAAKAAWCLIENWAHQQVNIDGDTAQVAEILGELQQDLFTHLNARLMFNGDRSKAE